MFTLSTILAVRDAAAESTSTTTTSAQPAISHTVVILLSVLLVLLVLALLLMGTLLVMRQRRRNSKSHILPVYDEKRFSTSSTSSSHRRVMDRPSESSSSDHVFNEKLDLINNSSAPPQNTLPEIRITFPEEVDEAGKRQSGRVVVVRVGDGGNIGLEPAEDLPDYKQVEAGRFQSIDLDRVGGLVEKARNNGVRITQ